MKLPRSAEKFGKKINKENDPLDCDGARIVHDSNIISSRTFVIRYCDEEVEINDILVFEATIPVHKNYLETEFYLEADLMFVDFSSFKPKASNDSFAKNDSAINNLGNMPFMITQFLENPDSIKKVSTSTFKILQVPQIINEYFYICFDQQYFCQFHCTLHSTLTGFVFHYHSIDKNMKKMSLEFNSVGEYFFKDKYGDMPTTLDMSKADQIYTDYVNVMSQVHKRLSSQYKRIITECICEEKRQDLGKVLEIKPFKHPGDDSDDDENEFSKNKKLEESKNHISESISLNSSKSEESKILSKNSVNMVPIRPKGDEEEMKRGSMFISSSPQPIHNDDAVHTPSITYEDISVNDEHLDVQHESDKIEGINDKII